MFKKRVAMVINRGYLLPFLVVVSLITSCVMVSSRKFFWNDELLSFFLIDDPSFLHMMSAWGDKFNQAPPLYFILGWIWDKLFGSTDLSLRLFSSVTICITFIVVWVVLRRTYDFWSASLGALSVFCLSELVLYHNAEVRMYGLFSATCAFGFLLFDTINRTERVSWRLLILNCLTHAAIVLTHLYGVFYSAAFLAAFLLSDRLLKRFQLPVYLSVVAGWASLAPLAVTIVKQSDNSAKWFQVIGKAEFFNYFIFSPYLVQLLAAFIIISAFLYLVSSLKRSRTLTVDYPAGVNSEVLLLVLVGVLIGVPFLALAITLKIKPILNERYIIPTITIGWSILLAYLTSRLFPDHLFKTQKSENDVFQIGINPRNLVLATLAFMLLLYPIRYAKHIDYYLYRPGANDASFGHIDLPIAMEAGHDFLPRLRYTPDPQRYFHIRDWEIAVKNTESGIATGDYTHLEALSRHYPFIQSVQSQDFLRKYSRFLVLNEKDQKWFEWRIQNNPEYKTQSLGMAGEGAWGELEMFLVDRQQ